MTIEATVAADYRVASDSDYQNGSGWSDYGPEATTAEVAGCDFGGVDGRGAVGDGRVGGMVEG